MEKSVADPLNAHRNFSSHFYVVTGDNIMRQNGICVFSVTVMWYLNGHVMKWTQITFAHGYTKTVLL